MFDRELDAFKTEVDLRVYAASLGYELDRKECWRGSAVMRNAAGDKIVIKRDRDGHFVYFSVRDDDDHGTIIDFAKRRIRGSLGHVRKELRSWLGRSAEPPLSLEPLQPVSKDRTRVLRAFLSMRDAPAHPYLEQTRGIPAALLAGERFRGCVRVDRRGNAVFPHFDADGLSGYELKNRDFTGFASGGAKALWMSNSLTTDSRLVFCESAIDALSYAALYPDTAARYASIGGKPNPSQLELMRAAVARMPTGAEVVAAMDADASGRDLVGIVRGAFDLAGRADLYFVVREPDGFKDWNDQLRANRPTVLPCRPGAVAGSSEAGAERMPV